MGNSLKTFRAPHLAKLQTLDSFTVLSGSYFRVANELRAMASETERSRWPSHFYVFPAITMYIAAFEAFLKEHLALSLHKANHAQIQKSNDIERINKLIDNSHVNFKDWVKDLFCLYDSMNVGINTTCDEYHNLIALKELRNSIVHYTPSFIDAAIWPARLEQALHKNKLEVMNSGWVTYFSRVEVANWAHDSVRGAIELFCSISGAENPFTTTEADGILNWEWVGPILASQPTSTGKKD